MNKEGKYLGKFRSATTRLRSWDYSSDGGYYVTICTKNNICWLGEVKSEKVALSSIGKFAHKCWLEIPAHFPFVELDEFIVMPNHIHGVIFIDKNQSENESINIVETQDFVSLPQGSKRKSANKFGPQSKNLPSVIRGFKAAVKKYAIMNDIPFTWQSKYYDRIIRSQRELQKIREYITNNPINWPNDRNKAGFTVK